MIICLAREVAIHYNIKIKKKLQTMWQIDEKMEEKHVGGQIKRLLERGNGSTI